MLLFFINVKAHFEQAKVECINVKGHCTHSLDLPDFAGATPIPKSLLLGIYIEIALKSCVIGRNSWKYGLGLKYTCFCNIGKLLTDSLAL